ncbi:hypothetical protein BBP40_005743 [Aspergillus hancockii]|nr:hypothetical protein BBP40_005743 [Aspergillus hancockii]
MADFSEYAGPSDEWIALECTLPAPTPGLSVKPLKTAASKELIMRDHRIPTRDGSSLEARSYRPAGASSTRHLPVYIHLHGGGFLFGTIASEDSICSRIVAALAEQDTAPLPLVVVNVHYRHTPEHRYPTAWNDVEDAFHWVHNNPDEIGGDGASVVVGGISAGAWLAASTTLAQRLGENKELAARPKIKGQVLMIPALVHYECCGPQIKSLRDPQVSSWVQNRDAPILPLDRVKLFTELLGIKGATAMEGDLRLNPGKVTAERVRGLPPSTIVVAGRDPLRDEGLLLRATA